MTLELSAPNLFALLQTILLTATGCSGKVVSAAPDTASRSEAGDCTAGIGGCPLCAKLSADACTLNGFCSVIEGQRLNPSGCLEPKKPVGCYATGDGCGPAFTSLTDPNGDCWVFPSTCHPSDWGNATSSCPRAIYNTPACAP